VVAREAQRADHIGHPAAASDRRRPSVDHRVPHRPRAIVLGVTRRNHLAGEVGR
jgi:hypothetical protein